MSLWLTDEELFELTGYRQREKRYKALNEMGIHFRCRRSDGFPLVERAQFEVSREGRQRPNFAAAGG